VRSRDAGSRRVHLYRRADGIVVAYDLQGRRLLHDLVDYSMYLIDKLHLNPETVYQRIVQIALFVEELILRNFEYWQISNAFIKDFRGRQMMAALGGASRGAPDALRRAEQTVNAILHPALTWLFWVSDRGSLLPNQIGPVECSITCTRTVLHNGRATISSPLLFPWKRPGGARVGKTPSDIQLDIAREFLIESAESEYCKQRNLLILESALESGLRADSLASLRCAQFNALRIECAVSDTYPVVPDRQKFSYQTEYLIPLSLAANITNFICGARAVFVDQLNLSEVKTADGVFLSEKTGKPIKARTLTTIMSRAMRHAGLLPGSGAHALRRRFADDKIVEEICYRIENSMDTSSQSIAFALMQELGHTTTDSLFKYVSSNSARLHREAKSRQ